MTNVGVSEIAKSESPVTMSMPDVSPKLTFGKSKFTGGAGGAFS